MSGVRVGRIKKHRKSSRIQSRSVRRIMAIMEDSDKEEVPKEFLETGRTGRRNAMHDILHPVGAEITTADLPSKLQKLATADPIQAGPSKTDIEAPKEEQSKEGCS